MGLSAVLSYINCKAINDITAYQQLTEWSSLATDTLYLITWIDTVQNSFSIQQRLATTTYY